MILDSAIITRQQRHAHLIDSTGSDSTARRWGGRMYNGNGTMTITDSHALITEHGPSICASHLDVA